MKNFEVEYIKINPCVGSNIHECIKEATILALTEGQKVRFSFNGIVYEIDPNVIIKYVKENI